MIFFYFLGLEYLYYPFYLGSVPIPSPISNTIIAGSMQCYFHAVKILRSVPNMSLCILK